MLAPHIGCLYAEVANSGMPLEQANGLIEAACESAAEQIRREAWRIWQAEQHDAQVRAERLEEQQRQVAETLAHREREAAASRLRNEQLLVAEQMLPQRKRTLWNG